MSANSEDPYVIDTYDVHENHPTSIVNPFKNSNFNPAHFTFDSAVVNYVSLVFGILILGIVIYAIYLTYDVYAFSFSIVALAAIFILRPDVLESLKKNPVLQYYTIFITWALVNALDDFRNSQSYLFLAVLNMGLSVISFLTQIKWFIAVSIYINLYVLSVVAVLFKNNRLVHNTA